MPKNETPTRSRNWPEHNSPGASADASFGCAPPIVQLNAFGSPRPRRAAGAPFQQRPYDSPSTSHKLETSPALSPLRHAVSLSLLDDEEFMQIKSPRTIIQPLTPTSFGQILRGFCGRTSAHGIPHIGASLSVVGKLFWTIIFLICLIAFIVQTTQTFNKFLSRETIIEMELRFEPPPFPAVSVCNLNPYKLSHAVQVPVIKNIIDAFNYKISKKLPQLPPIPPLGAIPRVKRQLNLAPLLVHCGCRDLHDECIPDRSAARFNLSNTCICFVSDDVNLWPCYDKSNWVHTECVGEEGIPAGFPVEPKKLWPKKALEVYPPPPNATLFPCVCNNVSYSCVKTKPGGIPWWDPDSFPIATPPPTTTTMDPRFLIEQGLGDDVNDETAITMKANENVVFAAGRLPEHTRKKLSYSLEDLIIRCVFNGKKCDGTLDFEHKLDANFGSCFTFNGNFSRERYNTRAGPVFGLRLLLNVNQTDYLPSTEAAGVRVNVHEQRMMSFPDTFGYSAPVGFVSSFGIKAYELIRLGKPYGKCVKDGFNTPHMHNGRYSSEDCIRSCLQRIMVRVCKCGDPRLPRVLDGLSSPVPICPGNFTRQRRCLDNITQSLSVTDLQKNGCKCKQPCNEFVFQVTYSAAAWPAKQYQTGQCPFELNNDTFCSDYYREHTAFVEVFYEKLNFEMRREKQAYGTESLLADLGGNIGLWIGFSAITCVEWILLFIEMILYCFDTDRKRRNKRKRNFGMKRQITSVDRVSTQAPHQQGLEHIRPRHPILLNRVEQG